MKKLLWLIVCLMTMVMSTNAQDDMYLAHNSNETSEINVNNAANNNWLPIKIEADELLGNDTYTALIYSTSDASVILWDNNDKKFRITAHNQVFDSKYGENGYMVKGNFFHAIVGYYDINGKLIDKRTCSFIVGNTHKEGDSIRFGMKRYEGKHIVSYLRNKKGYVRIVTSLYLSNNKFDIKVPCLNN